MRNADIDAGVQEDQLFTLSQDRLDNVRITAFDNPPWMRIAKTPNIGNAVCQWTSLRATLEGHLIQ